MTKAQEEQIWKAIYKTSIPEEIKAVYLLANSVDIMANNVLRRIKSVYRTLGHNIDDNGKLRSVREYLRYIKYATEYFEKHIEQEVTGATFDIGGTMSYDCFQNDSREIAHLMLRYLDRTAKNNENCQSVFEHITSLPSCGLFTEKDFERYRRLDND